MDKISKFSLNSIHTQLAHYFLDINLYMLKNNRRPEGGGHRSMFTLPKYAHVHPTAVCSLQRGIIPAAALGDWTSALPHPASYRQTDTKTDSERQKHADKRTDGG